MRTVLYGIRLLIEADKIIEQHFIRDENGGAESKIAERPRERECERDCTWRKGEYSVRHKMSH